jgi:hypothetical protein
VPSPLYTAHVRTTLNVVLAGSLPLTEPVVSSCPGSVGHNKGHAGTAAWWDGADDAGHCRVDSTAAGRAAHKLQAWRQHLDHSDVGGGRVAGVVDGDGVVADGQGDRGWLADRDVGRQRSLQQQQRIQQGKASYAFCRQPWR